MNLLGRCGYKLPHAKAQALLGYEPIIGFDEGMRGTLGWLRFAGFPVSAAGPTNPYPLTPRLLYPPRLD